MIDELDLAFDDHSDRGRHRRRRRGPGKYQSQKKKKKKKKRSRSGLALLLSVVLLAVLGGGGWFAYQKVAGFFTTPDYVTQADSAEVTIEIKKGALLADVAQTLKDADVIKSEQAFIDATNANSKAKGIQPGFYKLRVHLSGADALAMLLDLTNRVVHGVTIPEGMITLQIYQKLSDALGIPVDDFKTAAKDPAALGIPDWWFKRTDGKKAANSVEGFLFPATYEFPPNVTAADALKMMVQKFLTVTGDMGFADTVQNERHISPYEALIAASIAQEEAVQANDFAKVVRVLYNRVYSGKFPCSCLQIDSAVNYWLRLQGKDPKDSSKLLQSELNDPKNPYATRGTAGAGMPLGPIGNPGEAALRGAMDPAVGDWMFFMSIDAQGTMAYAVTYAEHCKNYQKAVANGILTGTC